MYVVLLSRVSFLHVSFLLLGILAGLISSNGARDQPPLRGGYTESTFDVTTSSCAWGLQTSPQTTSFDVVTQYGASGDGKNDCVQAFDSAWKAACAAGGSVAITIPGGMDFLVSRVQFAGPCKSSEIHFQIFGNIVAPVKDAWKDQAKDFWLSFSGVNGLVVDGNGTGTINGQGNSWWPKNSTDPAPRPTALIFGRCNNLQVKGLNHKDSPRNHIAITSCTNVQVENLNIQSPADSPNTDGIDISGSSLVQIHDSVMATGDDCIAIIGGTSNVNIRNITCGPGHGISIGSLGKDGAHDEVSGINITGCTFMKSENGVRIKTWQGGSGFAKDITYSGIEFVETNNPVLIDQYYCPAGSNCEEKASAVKISNVRYYGVHGTSACREASVILNCSKTVACEDIILYDINIVPAGADYPNKAICTNVKGQTTDIRNPDLSSCVLKNRGDDHLMNNTIIWTNKTDHLAAGGGGTNEQKTIEQVEYVV